jgi:hypothetical protein
MTVVRIGSAIMQAMMRVTARRNSCLKSAARGPAATPVCLENCRGSGIIFESCGVTQLREPMEVMTN